MDRVSGCLGRPVAHAMAFFGPQEPSRPRFLALRTSPPPSAAEARWPFRLGEPAPVPSREKGLKKSARCLFLEARLISFSLPCHLEGGNQGKMNLSPWDPRPSAKGAGGVRQYGARFHAVMLPAEERNGSDGNY